MKPNPWSVDTVAPRLAEIEECLQSDDPRIRSVFTQTFLKEAKTQAENLHNRGQSDLAGALVSIKDLLDVKGYVTKAGTQFMKNDPQAKDDAPTVKRLREAGAVFVGHTNMTELAYSGLGLNPHYGTPENALVKGSIPGGSTSGGAVSVAHGFADIAIGTDTGGSLRIPAAFNGIVGFKPTQKTVSRDGCKALSRSLDSVGPMAKTVAICDLAYRILAAETAGQETLSKPEFVVPNNYGMDDLEPAVAVAFDAAKQTLSDNGFNVTEAKIEAVEHMKELAVWHFSAIESRGEYDDAYQNHRDLIDPRVASPTRMGRADEVDAVTYRKTLNLREELVNEYRSEISDKILLMPTVPILPPTFESMEQDDEYSRINLQALRNPSIANVMDCCSISLPFEQNGSVIGVMMTACGGHDLDLLRLAQHVETKFLEVN